MNIVNVQVSNYIHDMRKALRSEAVRLRVEEELSYSAIIKRLGVSKSTLSYWLKDYPLTNEKILQLRKAGWMKGEAAREKYRNKRREEKDKAIQEVYNEQYTKIKNLSEESLFIAGLILYLAEGDKRNPHRICLANTDPGIILFFIAWLDKFLGVKRSRVKVQLHLYENMDINKEQDFWRDCLSLYPQQFYKTSIRKLKEGSFTYPESFRHGTCSVYVLNTRLKTEVTMALKAFLDLYKKI